jgi:hypothetical protein
VRGINAAAGSEAEVQVRGALLVGRCEQGGYFFVLAGEFQGQMVSFPRIIGDALLDQLLAAGLS